MRSVGEFTANHGEIALKATHEGKPGDTGRAGARPDARSGRWQRRRDQDAGGVVRFLRRAADL